MQAMQPLSPISSNSSVASNYGYHAGSSSEESQTQKGHQVWISSESSKSIGTSEDSGSGYDNHRVQMLSENIPMSGSKYEHKHEIAGSGDAGKMDKLKFPQRQKILTESYGRLASIGTIRHFEFPIGKKCIPCKMFMSGSCQKGESCPYCHMPHSTLKRQTLMHQKSVSGYSGQVPVPPAEPQDVQLNAYPVSSSGSLSASATGKVATEETGNAATTVLNETQAQFMACQLEKSQNISDRIDAATQLRGIQGLDKMSPNVRGLVCASLGKALRDRHYKVRAMAACALSNMGRSAVPHLRALSTLLDDAHVEARAAAAFTVGRIAGEQPEAAKHAVALSTLLQDKHCKVRAAAASGIAAMGLPEPHVAEALAELLADTDENCRAQAAYALGKLGDAVVPYVGQLVSTLADKSIRVRESALHSLGRCGEAARPHILMFVFALRDEQGCIRAAAANAIGNLGEIATPVATQLAPALRDENGHVRAAAAFALGKLGSAAQPYMATLEEMQYDSCTKVKKAATFALAKLSKP
eukprot:gnl/MRDRNA2_/MRDRNA2_86684_c0_seq1.p1 gnl/MRDRNA2_/MRDRNA2_86684_c0~~gnl/MRDRNA2_/MRDRNA2_86684_c0_seq1.p1  ORF type:complete len:527 (-),score=92.26 gnl/MRDRNA2_/MRDRNA2_86684_c0_seq1:270-1850(-)